MSTSMPLSRPVPLWWTGTTTASPSSMSSSGSARNSLHGSSHCSTMRGSPRGRGRRPRSRTPTARWPRCRRRPDPSAPGDRRRSPPRSRAGPRRGRLAAHEQYAAGIWCAACTVASARSSRLGLASRSACSARARRTRPRRARPAAALRGPLAHGRHRPRRAAARRQRGGQVRRPTTRRPSGSGRTTPTSSREHGFNSVRLGVDFRGLMPTPGVVEYGYIEQLARTGRGSSAGAGIFVLIDFHQDGFAPKYNGNGLPDWMAIDDGLPEPARRRLPALLHPEPGDAAGLREPLGEPARARRHRPAGLLRPGRDRGRAALRAAPRTCSATTC